MSIKRETRVKYEGELSVMRRSLMHWISALQEGDVTDAAEHHVRKLQVLLEKVRGIENALIDGAYRDSTVARNAIKAAGMSVDRWRGIIERGEKEEDSKEDGTPILEAEKEPELPELSQFGEQVMEQLEHAQATFINLYNVLVERNRLAARVPEIIEIKNMAGTTASLMQRMAKMGGDL